jgi:hypothetical protein
MIRIGVFHCCLTAGNGVTLMCNDNPSRKYSQENGNKQRDSLIAFGHHAHGKTLPVKSF